MADDKKYYWLKLKDDFFKTREIKKLRKIAGGDTFTIIYLKLQLLTIKNNGILVFEGTEENLIEQLSLELDEDEDNIQVTLNFLQANKLIEQISKDEYLLPKVIEQTGSETTAAERMRKMRAKRNEVTAELQAVTNSYTEIEIEKEKDIYSSFNDSNHNSNNNCSSEKPDEPHTPKNNSKDSFTVFDEIWKLYPVKRGKSKISNTTKKELESIGFEKMKLALDRYVKEIEQKRKNGFKDLQYQNGSTWLRTGYQDYLVSEEEPPKKRKPFVPKFKNMGYI